MKLLEFNIYIYHQPLWFQGENPSVSFVQTQTIFGNKCIIINGQKYRFTRKTASNLLTYRCSHKLCTSQVLTDPDNTKIVDIQGDHSHDNISNIDDQCENAPSYKIKSTEQLLNLPSKDVLKESNTIKNTFTVLGYDVGADNDANENENVVGAEKNTMIQVSN